MNNSVLALAFLGVFLLGFASGVASTLILANRWLTARLSGHTEALTALTNAVEQWTAAVNTEFPAMRESIRAIAPRVTSLELRLNELERKLGTVGADEC